jgi:TRAP-type C4-dicarboxylate transport system substrate-binding protein
MTVKRQILLFVTLFFATSLIWGGGISSQAEAKDKPIKLTYAFFAPAGTFPGKQMAHWAKEVEKRTDGLVKVQTFPAGTLLGAWARLRTIRDVSPSPRGSPYRSSSRTQPWQVLPCWTS